jgi:hypothetical protein
MTSGLALGWRSGFNRCSSTFVSAHGTGHSRKHTPQMYFPCIGCKTLSWVCLHHHRNIDSNIETSLLYIRMNEHAGWLQDLCHAQLVENPILEEKLSGQPDTCGRHVVSIENPSSTRGGTLLCL